MNHKISICTTIKNRSIVKYKESDLDINEIGQFLQIENILNVVKNENIGNPDFNTIRSLLKEPFIYTKKCFDSINQCINANKELQNFEYEIVASDWKSTDCNIYEQISSDFTTPNIVILEDPGFSRGRGLNEAFKKSTGDIVFFIDVDLIFNNPFMLEECIYNAIDNKTVWPVCYKAKDPAFFTLQPEWAGYGICMMKRDIFEKYGLWPEYNKWGGEDTHLYQKMMNDVPVARKLYQGYVHQWHTEKLRSKEYGY